jgi:hypothetical protein
MKHALRPDPDPVIEAYKKDIDRLPEDITARPVTHR